MQWKKDSEIIIWTFLNGREVSINSAGMDREEAAAAEKKKKIHPSILEN